MQSKIKVSTFAVGKTEHKSLSRLVKHNQEHECGAITAFRAYNDCGFHTDKNDNKLDGRYDEVLKANRDYKPVTKGAKPIPNTRKQNNLRNKALVYDLVKLNYGFIKVIGKYYEGGSLVTEVSYVVIDLKDTGKLQEDLVKLGTKYQQDSILFLEKGVLGSVNKKAKAYLYGSNKCKNNSIPLGKRKQLGKNDIGTTEEEVITKLGNRPLSFRWENKLDIEKVATSANESKLGNWEASSVSRAIANNKSI